MKVLVLVLSLGVLAAACSSREGDDATVPPADEPAVSVTPAPVPGLFLVEPGGTGTSGVPGTRCWADSCIDYAGPVTTARPTTFPAGVPLEWQAEGGTLTEIQHAWAPASLARPTPTSDGNLVWSLGAEFAPGEITTPSEPGDYVLIVFTRYDNGGDVLFGFYLRIE